MSTLSHEPKTGVSSSDSDRRPGHPWERLRLSKRELSEIAPPAVLLLLVGVLTWLWTQFDWERLTSFHLYVFDLGVSYQSVWAAAHGTTLDYAGPNGYRLLTYLFVPAILLLPPDEFLRFFLGFQNAWVFLGAIPLYLVARRVLASQIVALCLSVAYLLCTPLYGVLWVPFQYEALFPTLYLLAYWQYRTHHPRRALLIAGASLFSNIGAAFVLAAWATGLIIEPAVPRLRSWLRRLARTSDSSPGTGRPYWTASTSIGGALLLASAGFFGVATIIYGAHFFGYATRGNGVGLGGGALAATSSLPSPAILAFLTLMVVLAPLLFLPLLGREERWALLPFAAAGLLLSSPGPFFYPFKSQYSAFVVAPAFIAAVRGLERLAGWADHWEAKLGFSSAGASPIRGRLASRGRSPVWSIAILVCVVGSGLVLAPWGPANSRLAENPTTAAGYYNLAAETGGNATLHTHLWSLVHSVPPQGGLLAQNDMPTAVARPYYYVPGYYRSTFAAAYLLTDPYDSSFYPGSNFGPDPGSMLDWANYYIGQGWSTQGEADGALLLAKNHSGPPDLFDPVHQTFLPGDFNCCALSAPWGPNQSGYVAAGPRIPFDGEYSVFSPGQYRINLSLAVDHPSPSDRLELRVGEDAGATILTTWSFNGTLWQSDRGTVFASVNMSFHFYVPGMYFAVYVDAWNSTLTFNRLSLDQVGPASTLGSANNSTAPPDAGLPPPPAGLNGRPPTPLVDLALSSPFLVATALLLVPRRRARSG